MFSVNITPRFYETDAFGHINNTVIAGWFEAGRAPILHPQWIFKN
jgi:acyl-CoA thioester hydrolase